LAARYTSEGREGAGRVFALESQRRTASGSRRDFKDEIRHALLS